MTPESNRAPRDECPDTKDHVYAEGEWWCVPKGMSPDDPKLKVEGS